MSVVSGFVGTAGAALCSHMNVDKLAFTGSTKTGKMILKSAARSNLKTVTRELGGKSPIIVLDAVDVEEPNRFIDPARVLEKAHSRTKKAGSSTACIIALRDQGIHAVNLGDSGFIVVREGSTIFRSPSQQHDFNFPFQLDADGMGDLPKDAQVFTVPVAPGDVIVAGTDGLFDNLYTHEVAEVILQSLHANLDPQGAAQKIGALARERALDKTVKSPFAAAADEAGFYYTGGKLDDISVVVSYVVVAASGS